MKTRFRGRDAAHQSGNQQKGGFRKSEDPTELANRFQQVVTSLVTDIYAKEFELTSADAVAMGVFQNSLQGQIQNFGELLGCFANRERHEGRVLEQMKEGYGKIKNEFERLLTNPAIVKSLAKLPELRDKAQKARELAAQIETEMDELTTFNLSNSLRVAISRSRSFLLHQGLTIGDTLRTLLSPEKQDALKAYMLYSVFGTVEDIAAYSDRQVVADLNHFMEKFFQHGDAFVREARERREILPWNQLGCFKAMCYAMAAKNAQLTLSFRSKPTTLDANILAIEVLTCPYSLILEDETVDRLAAIAKAVPSEKIARIIVQNPQWVEPGENFKGLETLIDELKTSSQSLSLFRLIEGRPLDIAIRMVQKMKQNTDYLGAYEKNMTAKRMQISSGEFAEYMLEVGDEKVGTETFHSILNQVLPHISNEVAIRIVRASTGMYLSGLWEEVALLYMGDDKEKQIANAALEAIEAEEFENARTVITSGRTALEEEKHAESIERVRAEFKDATPPQVALFCATFDRLEAQEIPRRSFAALRKRGLDTMVAVAKESERLNDHAFKAIFASQDNRNLFARALQTHHDGLAERLNTAKDENTITFELERHLDEAKSLERGKFKRIVLVAGEQVAETIAEKLRDATSLEVKVVSQDNPRRGYISSILHPGDAVIIDTSHLGHNASGLTIALCRSRGIEYFEGSNTNVDRLISRLNAG